MISLVFGSDPFQLEKIPPALFFRFTQETLSKGEDGQIVARHVGSGFWRTTGNHHTSGKFVGKAEICFDGGDENFPQRFGPYEKVRIAGGYLYGDGKLVAQFSKTTRNWVSLKDRTEWPIAVVKAV